MARSFSLKEQSSSLFSGENSFDQWPSSLGLDDHELIRFPSHEEPGSQGYDEYFDPQLESKYECPICHLGLREPVQTSCGHRFCSGCIVRFIRNGDSKCPVRVNNSGPVHAEHQLSESQIFLDNFVKREMMDLEVFCRMSKQHGCTWKGPLGKLQKHFESCSKYPQKCEKCGEDGIERDKMVFHLEQHCPKVKMKCPFDISGCTFEGLRCRVDKHVKEQLSNHVVDLVKTINSLKSAVAEMEEVLRRNESLLREHASQEECNQNELSTRTQHQQNEIDEMRRILESQERQREESRARLLECERRFCNGTYTWRIENYIQCREDAINGVMTAKWSPAFYTSPSGYKLCMRINLNGVDSGVGKQIALYVHIVQGDYDNILDWPFTEKFTLSILDQSDDVSSRCHISKTIYAEPHLDAFQRPTAPHNIRGFGYAEFASLEQICEPQFLKNDTLLVKFEIIH